MRAGCGEQAELYSVMRPKDPPHSSKLSWLRTRRLLQKLPTEEGFLIPGHDKSEDSELLCNERERACMPCTASATQKYTCQEISEPPPHAAISPQHHDNLLPQFLLSTKSMFANIKSGIDVAYDLTPLTHYTVF